MKRVKISGIVICALIVLVLILPFRVHKKVSAILVSMKDETVLEQVTVTYDGYYHVNLILNDRFSGKIIISNYPETNQIIDGEVEITSGISHADSTLEYEDGYLFGQLISHRFLMASLIPVYEHTGEDPMCASFSYSEGIYVVVGATDRESALNMINEMLDQS